MSDNLRTVVVVSLLVAAIAAGQENPQSAGRPQPPPFHFDALNFADADEYGLRSRLDVYVQVPLDIVTFVRRTEGYSGSYTITVFVHDEEGNRIREETWSRKIERSTFDSPRGTTTSDVTHRSLILSPGPVIVEVRFEDGESSKEYRLSKRVEIRQFDPNIFGISDLMLVSHVEEENGKRRIAPHLNPNVATLTEGMTVFFELYNPFEIRMVDVHCRVTRKNRPVVEKTDRQPIRKGVNTFLTRVGTQALGVGSYDLEITVTHPADSGGERVLASAHRNFTVEWLSGGTPISITDLDEAIEQLRYFAKQEDIEFIRKASDDNERRRRFEEFWERNNPVPGSGTNRAMVEYYSRVAYANEHFGHYIAGWKTDRGMVYIIYGPPSNIDRHPLDVESKPYEVWEYDDLNRRFIFIDESGFGDYRLLYPIWDERNRIR
ncbi:MAG: GWxTD domain-containing protein [Bacteroidota bacterium]|nr:GWxTD domain-containing protein [Bacteroidota bacterium]